MITLALQALAGAALFLAGAFSWDCYTMWKARQKTFCPTCLAKVGDDGFRLTSFSQEGDE